MSYVLIESLGVQKLYYLGSNFRRMLWWPVLTYAYKNMHRAEHSCWKNMETRVYHVLYKLHILFGAPCSGCLIYTYRCTYVLLNYTYIHTHIHTFTQLYNCTTLGQLWVVVPSSHTWFLVYYFYAWFFPFLQLCYCQHDILFQLCITSLYYTNLCMHE